MKKYCLAIFCMILFASLVYSHCQIPCGIYDDTARFTLLSEHIDTIEKSMKQIQALSQEENQDINQLVRWISNKDHHADEFSHIVTYYFLAQRIKPVSSQEEGYDVYVSKIVLLQQMIVYAMKTKQSTDLENVTTLRRLLGEFKTVYEKK